MGVPICGPKLSICCTLLSVWGIVQLMLMGIFLRIKSPAFMEDLPINETKWEQANYAPEYIWGIYNQASTNCFIAGGLYVGVFILSFIMWRMNSRNNYSAA